MPESMRTREEWEEMFRGQGIIFMPKLTKLARDTSYHHRSYDFFANLLVFKHPSNPAMDTSEPNRRLRDGGLRFWMQGAADARPKKGDKIVTAGEERERLEAEYWLELVRFAQSAKRGLPPCSPAKKSM